MCLNEWSASLEGCNFLTICKYNFQYHKLQVTMRYDRP